MSVTCPECSAVTRGATIHDADGPRVFRYCDLCGFATVEHLLSRRSNGASEIAVSSPPRARRHNWRGCLGDGRAFFFGLIVSRVALAGAGAGLLVSVVSVRCVPSVPAVAMSPIKHMGKSQCV